MKRLLATVVLLLTMSVALGVASAQEYTEQDAINLALNIPEFQVALRDRSDWYARAYDTGNKWDVWRVQFFNENDEDMGFADVNIAQSKVFVYDCYFGATDLQKEQAQPILRELVDNTPDILALMDDVASHEIYVDFDGYNDWWGVYIENGDDSLYLTVRFSGNTVESYDDPRILKIYFANVLSYDEWYGATSQQAIAVAFADSRVGDALANQVGWTTQTERIEAGIWQVSFWVGEEKIVEASVNLATNTILDVTP